MKVNSRTEAQPLRYGAVRVLKGRHAGKVTGVAPPMKTRSQRGTPSRTGRGLPELQA